VSRHTVYKAVLKEAADSRESCDDDGLASGRTGPGCDVFAHII
jgi:hypothetical protein